MSPGEKNGEALYAAAKFASLASTVKLRTPAPPAAPREVPAEAPRKYPVLQELAAERQAVKDAFSKLQIDLLEIKHRAAAKPPSGGAAEPAGRPSQPAGADEVKAPATGPVKKLPVPQEKTAAAPHLPGPAVLKYVVPASLGAACVVVLGVFLFLSGRDDVSFSLPPAAAAGLCLDKKADNVYFIDPLRQLLIAVSNGEKRVKSLHSFQSPGLKALACDGDAFWSSDGKNIYSHVPSGSYAVTGSYKTPRGVRSLCLDGGKLWAVSGDGKLLGYRAGQAAETDAVYELPAPVSAAVTVSDGKLWALDPDTGVLRIFSISGGIKKVAETNIKSFLPRGRLAGIASAGGFVWVMAANPAELVRVSVKESGL